MMRGLIKGAIMGAALAALAACGDGAEQAARDAAGPDCDADTSFVWAASDSVSLQVEAFARGPDCVQATATLTVRDDQGATLMTFAAPASELFGFEEANDESAMHRALALWVAQPDMVHANTASLPEWAPGADSPMAGEFPFYPAEGIDDEAYRSLREAARPMFCHVQGMESQACYALEDGALNPIGVQTFPG